MRAVFLLIPATEVTAFVSNVGRLPALGWNSWNAFGCDIDEHKILSAAEKMASLGLKDAGYEYVNIDDCWAANARDATTSRLVANATKFPSGIKGVADKVHALGLKLGIYSSAGTTTCAGFPASFGHEDLDAATFAEWGVDYLKYDNCGVPKNWTDECNGCVPDSSDGKQHPNGTCSGSGYCPVGYNYTISRTAQRYRSMRDALLAQNRSILFSLCDWGAAGVEQWGAATGHSWRTTPDIRARWSKVTEIINEHTQHLGDTDFFAHADADMLEVGNKGLSLAESRTHFALWAAMKSPLLMGSDLSKLGSDYLSILTNKHLLDFNQDNIVGTPARPYKWGTNPDNSFNASFPAEYWSGGFGNGRVLVLATNPLPTIKSKTIVWSEVPELKGNGPPLNVTYVWTNNTITVTEDHSTVDVQPHDTAAFVVQR